MTHDRERVPTAPSLTSHTMICTGLDMRIVNPETGELLRELTIDPERDYQPTGKPRGRPRRTPHPK
jgi:hypothetical protein